ncbi:hypothetical protein IW144_000428 [Coemansia sp. RSA 522]|nr:hypothetical protein IW144_000428 [Coemansia sp. RSA 522]
MPNDSYVDIVVWRNIVVTRVAAVQVAVQVAAVVVAAAVVAAVVARRRDGAAGRGAGTRGRAVARAAGADMAQDGGVAGGAVGAIRAAKAATAVVAAAVGATVAHVEDIVARAAVVAAADRGPALDRAGAETGSRLQMSARAQRQRRQMGAKERAHPARSGRPSGTTMTALASKRLALQRPLTCPMPTQKGRWRASS